jgi:hypothetical protein
MALRLLLLQHVRSWSYDTLEREARANVAYRDFCRIELLGLNLLHRACEHRGSVAKVSSPNT